MSFDRSALYPIIVPVGYVPVGSSVRPLIAGLNVALVEHRDARSGVGLMRGVLDSELDAAAVDEARAASPRVAADAPAQGAASGTSTAWKYCLESR